MEHMTFIGCTFNPDTGYVIDAGLVTVETDGFTVDHGNGTRATYSADEFPTISIIRYEISPN